MTRGPRRSIRKSRPSPSIRHRRRMGRGRGYRRGYLPLMNMKIVGLQLKNFRGFPSDSTEFPLGKLNLIFGPNSGGKSSILKALGSLPQSLSESRNRVDVSTTSWLPKGPWFDLGTKDSVLHKGHIIENTDPFSIGFVIEGDQIKFEKLNAEIEIEREKVYTVSVNFDEADAASDIRTPLGSTNDPIGLPTFSGPGASASSFLDNIPENERHKKSQIRRNILFLNRKLSSDYSYKYDTKKNHIEYKLMEAEFVNRNEFHFAVINLFETGSIIIL